MSYDTRQHHSSWDDILSPATGINPPGAASDPTFNITEVAWEFSASQDNVLAIVQQLPHGIDTSVPLRPHIHVYASVAPGGDQICKWRLEYKVYSRGDVVPSGWTAVNVDQTLTPTNYNTSQTINFGAIDISSSGLSAVVKVKLSRIVAGDSYNSPVYLDEFDMHAAFNAEGSYTEFA